ncbi:MAG: hypothetical protein GF308_01510 [Candidatus Heimdallarchaeota archaeon]|nr:hypothetical protein [Candidatus Heimdallarchaeota archaeon]
MIITQKKSLQLLLIILLFSTFITTGFAYSNLFLQNKNQRKIANNLSSLNPMGEITSKETSESHFKQTKQLSPSKSFSRTSTEKSWTYMVYMDGDNNLEEAAISDFEELERGGGTNDDVNVVVLLDRIVSYDQSNGDWTDARYYLIKEDIQPGINSQLVMDKGEVDMGDPKTLQAFLEFCFKSYPSENYCLVLWDHGAGVFGVCYDDTTSNDACLTMDEVQQAIKGATKTYSERINVLAMDACVMNMVEVAWEFRDQCDYFVASEESIPFDGYDYEPIIKGLHEKPTMTPGELSELLVNEYHNTYQNTDATCLSAIDLSKISGMIPVLNNFVSNITYAISSLNYSYMHYLARSETRSFFDGAFVDLRNYAQKVSYFIQMEEVVMNADALIAYMDQLVYYNWQHSSYKGTAYGITIFLPFSEYSVTEERIYEYINCSGLFAGMDWQSANDWASFVDFYYQEYHLVNPPNPPKLIKGQSSSLTTLKEKAHLEFSISLYGEDVYEFNCSIISGDVDIQIAASFGKGLEYLGQSALVNSADGMIETVRQFLTSNTYYIFITGQASSSTFTIEVNQYTPKNITLATPVSSFGGSQQGDNAGHFIQDIYHYFWVHLPKGEYSISLNNSATANYQLVIYDLAWSKLAYQEPLGLGSGFITYYNNTLEASQTIILEIVGFEGSGEFTIEIQQKNLNSQKVGLGMNTQIFALLNVLFGFLVIRVLLTRKNAKGGKFS